MREDTRAFVRELIDFHEANGRQNWITIRHFEKVKKKCSANYVRKWLRLYKKEGMALLGRKIRRTEPNHLMPQAVETAKRVLEVLKEDSSVSSSEGAAKLNMSRFTFNVHRKRLMTPGLLTREMKIQLGILPPDPEPGILPESKKAGATAKKTQFAAVDGLNIKQEKSGHRQTPSEDWQESEIEGRKSSRRKPTRHCLLCYIRLNGKWDGENVKSVPIRRSTRNYKDNPSVPIVTSSLVNGCDDDGELGENLNVIFALKNIFGLTSSDLVNVMKAANGRDPKEWYNLCESCDVILKEAIAIQHQVLLLSRDLEECKKKIEERIEKSSSESSKIKNGHGDLLVTNLIRQTISVGKKKKDEHFLPSADVDVIVKSEPSEEDDFGGVLDFGFHSDADADIDFVSPTKDPANPADVVVSEANPEETVDILDIIRSQPVKLTVCETCGAEMPPSKIPLHALREHDILLEGFTVFKCHKEGCKYSTLSKSHLRDHGVKVHTPYEKRKHVCQTCGKRFPVKCKLIDHLKVHTNALTRPYQCEICGSSFAVYSTLYHHRRCVHERNPKYTTRKKRDPATATKSRPCAKKISKTKTIGGGIGIATISAPTAIAIDTGSRNAATATPFCTVSTVTVPGTSQSPPSETEGPEGPATENSENTFISSPPQPQPYGTTDAPATSTISLASTQMYFDLSHASK